MTNTPPYKTLLFIVISSIGFQVFAQNLVPFTPRFDEDLKGDIITIGNTVLGPSNDPVNTDIGNNSNVNMLHIDIDSDASTFNSSSAELVIPNPNCYEIREATLYWGAVEPEDNTDDLTVRQIKFKGPSGGYVDITGDLIYRDETTALNTAYPYACAADVTNLVKSFPNSLGYYTVANVATKTGVGGNATPRNRNGYTAGWSLFIVYEDPTLPSKSITSFDGFSAIFRNQASVDIDISGFRTVPAPQPVRANLAFATLEGDLSLSGDRMRLNGSILSSTDRPGDNFFRSRVTQIDAQPVDNRVPNSSNTLGFDTGVLRVPNPGNTVIQNGDTSATMGLTTTSDFFLQYFFAFAVEIIEPKVVLTKTVEDEFGNDISDQVVNLGQELNYVISFQNIGNDDARELIIRDVLPINTTFDFPAGLDLPAGVTAVSYDAGTRELVLSVEDYLVEEGDPVSVFRIQANVVDNCTELSDACSNLVQNQAFASYLGTLNPDFIITDDPSVSSNTGCLLVPQATNFLADIEACQFQENAILCGDSTTLIAADGYDTYSWSTDPSGTPVIGTSQSLTVTASGTYYVLNTAPAPCQSIIQVFDVITYGENQTNPIIPQADEVVICPDDGKELPNIFLCGLNDFRELNADITDSNSIIWEQLNEASCAPVGNTDCANEDGSCSWNEVATGTDYTANTAGQFRLTVNYDGGCFNQFYFNVYQNILDPTVTVSDILCDSPGTITVSNVPSNYEYSLDGITYQDSPIFTVTTAGVYTVYIRQTNVPDSACVFTIPNVIVRERDFSFEANVSQPLCNGDRGSIQVVANDAEPQYTFSLFENGVLVNTVGPIVENNYDFENLGAGVYSATVETEDGCIDSEEVTIIEPPLLTLTADLVAPFIDCEVQAVDDNGDPVFDEDGNPVYEEAQGEIMMNASGGTPPYVYFINSTTDFQSDPVYVITSAGTYNITVVDANNCEASTSLTVDEILPPEFTVSATDIICSDSGNVGIIEFIVTNTYGSSLEFSIDDGATYSNAPIFTNLAPGTYNTHIRYTFGISSCITDSEPITIAIPDPLTGTAATTVDYTCTGLGEITVDNVSGGTPNYSYSIDGVNFQTSNVFPGLADGSYEIIIQDANGCTFTVDAVIILSLDPPTNLDFSGTAVNCPSNTSDVTLTATGGVNPLEYRITAPAVAVTAYQASNVFTSLAPGTYTFEVRDANDCVYSEQYAINALPTLNITAQTQNDATCLGANDGTILVTVFGTTTFEYSVNGSTPVAGTSPFTLNALGAGSYNIIITDTVTNCEASASATINEPTAPLTLIADESPITCIDEGSVTLNASGGWGGYSYTITQPDATVLGPQSNNIFTNLTQAGTYTATVDDINGCQESTTFDLTTPDAVVATISGTSDLCFDGTDFATLEVLVTAGVAPFEFSINGGPFQMNNVFENLAPGTYTIVVRDAYGCILSLPATTIAPELTATSVLSDNIDCTTSSDAAITTTISGGSAPFTYEVSVDGNPYSNQGATPTSFTFNTAAAGSYQFRITDSLGCIAESNVVVVNPLSPPVIAVVAQTLDIQCNGDSNGAIDVTIDTTAGTPPFVINILNTTTGTDFGTQTSGLPAGVYTITLTDGNECTDVEAITLNEPDALIVDIDAVDIECAATGISQGQIIVNSVTGGTPPYDYYVTGDNGYTNQSLGEDGTTPLTFDVIDFGLYQLNVIDANGCSLPTQDILIASPPDDLDINIDESTVNCAAGGSATITVSTPLATGPFYFDIYNGTTPPPPPMGTWTTENPPGSQMTTFTGLTPGVTYTFIVYDETTMCYYFETATTPIPTNSTLTVSAPDVDNIKCTGDGDGDVSFTVTSIYGTDVNVSYEIFYSLSQISTGITGTATITAGSTITVSDLGPLAIGNYFVLISETSGSNAGCGVVTTPFNISESQIPLDLSVSVDQNANCNPASGIISAIGSDGTAPYQYQITTTATAPAATDPNWDNVNVFNEDAGTYYVHVQDAYGCIVTSPAQVIDLDPSPVIDVVVTDPCTSIEGTYEIEIRLVTAGAAPYSISIDGGAFQTQALPFTLSGLTSGTHTVAINDSNSCGNNVSIDILAPLNVAASASGLPTCSDDDGEITVNATGGSGAYTYTIVPSPPSVILTGNVFSGVPAGVYTINIEDADPLRPCTTSTEVTLGAPTPVTFDASPTDVSCNGGNDGTITVEFLPGNDNPIYTYEIVAPIAIPAQNSNIFTGLTSNTYTVQVNSGRGCSEMADFTVGEPDVLQISATATEFSCNADNSINTSIVTISGSGGTPSYSYSIDGVNYFDSNNFEIVDTGVIQMIDVYVSDENACVVTTTITINPLPTITAAAAVTTSPIDCNGTGEVMINVTGGSGDFNYTLLPDGTPQTSNTFTITEPGTYFFQVDDLDTGCFFLTDPFEVSPFDTIEAQLNAIQDLSCFEVNVGEIELSVSGHNGAYNYQLIDSMGVPVGTLEAGDTATDPQVITGLAAGNYTVNVTATDSPFCSAVSNTENIATPIEAVMLDASESFSVTCTNDQGVITSVGMGGTPPYMFELTGPTTVPFSDDGTFENLSAGLYTVRVRDDNGCFAREDIELEVPNPIDATFSPSTTLLDCFGDQNATITITNITGGQGVDYNYTLNRISPNASTFGPQTMNVFTDLGAGVYSITIQDQYSCFLTSDEITIDAPDQVDANLALNTTPTCLIDATITLTGSGGTPPYSYSETMDFSTPLGDFPDRVTFSVAPGIYEYFIQDANGCVSNVSDQITVNQPVPLTINLDSSDTTINCVGDSNGVINAIAQGGLGDYIYTIQDGTGATITATQNTPGVFIDLPAGFYTVYVTSGDCDATSDAIEITEPENGLAVDFELQEITCRGADDGILEILTTGGTGNVQYAISPNLDQFFNTNVFENLEPGDYNVIVQDEAGCFATFNFNLEDPDAILLGIVSDTIFPETCFGDLDGSFSVEISGGALPYSVSLDDEDGPYTTGDISQTIFTFDNVSGGNHIIYVRDNQGCESIWNIPFPEAIQINPTVNIEYNCTDNIPGNIVTVTVDDTLIDISVLDYSLNDGPYQSSNQFINVAPGVANYILVRHPDGCIKSTELFDIESIEPLSLTLVEVEYNQIVAFASGGYGNYEYTFNDESTGSDYTYTIDETGTYIVTVTDAAGCVAVQEIYIEFIDVCIPNYFTPNDDGVLDTWYVGCADDYPNLTTQIFDRYGRIVAILRRDAKWDGRYENRELPSGDYWYIVTLGTANNDREFVGHFTLYR